MIMRPDHRLDIHAAARRAGPSVAGLAGALAAWALLVGCGGGDAAPVTASEEAVADGASVAGPAAEPAGESAGEAESTEAPSGETLQGEAVTAGGGYLVRWRSGPAGIPALEPFSLEVEVEQSAGVPVVEAELRGQRRRLDPSRRRIRRGPGLSRRRVHRLIRLRDVAAGAEAKTEAKTRAKTEHRDGDGRRGPGPDVARRHPPARATIGRGDLPSKAHSSTTVHWARSSTPSRSTSTKSSHRPRMWKSMPSTA